MSHEDIKEIARRRLENEESARREAQRLAEEEALRIQEAQRAELVEAQVKARIDEERIRIEVERAIMEAEVKKKAEEREAAIQAELERLRNRTRTEVLEDTIAEMRTVQTTLLETITSLRSEIESVKRGALRLERPIVVDSDPVRNIRDVFSIRVTDTPEVKEIKQGMLRKICDLNVWRELWFRKKINNVRDASAPGGTREVIQHMLDNGGEHDSATYNGALRNIAERQKYTNPDVPKAEKRIVNMDLEYMPYDEFVYLLANGVNVISESMCWVAGCNTGGFSLPFTKTITRSFTYNVFKQQTYTYISVVGRHHTANTLELPHTDFDIVVFKICPLDWELSQLETYNPLTKEFCRRFEHPVRRDEPVHYSVFAKMFAVLNSIYNEYESLTWTEDHVYTEARKLRCVLMRGGFV
jgi:hypothetical protein